MRQIHLASFLPDKEQNPNHFSDTAFVYSPGKRKWPGERKLLIHMIIKMFLDKKCNAQLPVTDCSICTESGGAKPPTTRWHVIFSAHFIDE